MTFVKKKALLHPYESQNLIGRFNWLFWSCSPKNLKTTFYVLSIYLHAKNKFDSSILPWDRVNSEMLLSDWLRAFFEFSKLKTFKQTFIFLQSISVCKKSHWHYFYLRYRRFKNKKAWWDENIFDQALRN